MRRLVSTTLLLLALMGAIVIAAEIRGAEDHGPIKGRLLTNRQSSDGPIGYAVLATAAGSQAHVIWTEGQVPHNTVYSRDMPFGSTRRIPREVGVGLVESAAAPDGRTCTIWGEPGAGQEGSDLFIWCSDYLTPISLSDTALSNGNVKDTLLIMDQSGQAHVAWVETCPGPYQQELFYWREDTKQTQILSHYSSWSYVLSPDMKVRDGVVFAAWSEYAPPNGPFTPYYWDSATGNVIDLSLPEHTYANQTRLMLDSIGNRYVLWMAEQSSADRCPHFWSSITGLTQSMSAPPNDCWTTELHVLPDSVGNLHAVYGSQRTSGDGLVLVYWSSEDPTPTVIATGHEPEQEQYHLETSNDGTLHFMWLNKSWTGSNPMYHWDSTSGQVQSIGSAYKGALPYDPYDWIVDTANTAHVAWIEPVGDQANRDVYYWNSADLLATQLSDPAMVTGTAHLPTLWLGPADDVHAAWFETSLTTDQMAVFHWSEDNPTSRLSADLGSKINPLFLWVGGGVDVQAIWTDSESTDLYYWSESEGIVNLSGTVPANGDIDLWETQLILDDEAHSYILWLEESGIGAEGIDLFGAWKAVVLPHSVNLPLVRR